MRTPSRSRPAVARPTLAALLAIALGAACGGPGEAPPREVAATLSAPAVDPAVHHDVSPPLPLLVPAAPPAAKREHEHHVLPRPHVAPGQPDPVLQATPG